MPRHAGCGLLFGVATALAGTALADPVDFSLTHLDRVEMGADRLEEPSGLALAADGGSLWVVDDGKDDIFELDLDGTLLRSIDTDGDDLEGVALDGSGNRLLAVEEALHGILAIDLETEAVERHLLADMAGLDRISAHNSDPGKGLEGITVDPRSGHVWVLDEAAPGLLIEISADLTTILAARPLGAANGFVDDDLAATEIDYSGIAYDSGRQAFWIVSDEARRLFLYDIDGDRVIQSAALGYGRKGGYLEIEKAEGVAVDPEAGRLYVVSDDETRIHVFDLR